MKSKKLKLTGLKVKSFVTELNQQKVNSLKAGAGIVPGDTNILTNQNCETNFQCKTDGVCGSFVITCDTISFSFQNIDCGPTAGCGNQTQKVGCGKGSFSGTTV